MNYEELEERPYIDSFHYIEDLGEKLQDRKLIKINRFLQEDRIKQQEEIERLKEENKKYNKWIESLNKDNHRLNNIIKEVREYIGSYNLPDDLGVLGEAPISISELKHILEILDKGE